MDLKSFEKPEYFVNRELSWLKFDDRVLSEARDKNLPLFERLKFTSIVSSNLDEFYMVRVASLKDQVHAGYEKTDIAGMGPKAQLKEISAQTHELVRSQYSTLNRSLLPALEKVPWPACWSAWNPRIKGRFSWMERTPPAGAPKTGENVVQSSRRFFKTPVER